MQDGTVLVVGGFDSATIVATAELYDPTTGTWHASASMSTARELPTATLLNDGTVLVVGGDNEHGFVGSAEIYDPTPSGSWEPSTQTIGYRKLHTSTLLADGDVLAAGGSMGNTDTIDSLASAELFHR